MARKRSLTVLAAKSKSAGWAAANPQPVANRVVELDPALVHAGGIEDSIEISAAEIERLTESIRAAGQKVPILVRPHPKRPGEYQIVAGRRRLAACKQAGLSVRAEIQDLNERDLVLGQAIENIAREDLSYIERARLAARMVNDIGLYPTDIDMAFGCGKTDRSRYLKIGRGVPPEILQWIGKAPSVGRPRWEKFVSLIEDSEGALGRVKDALAAANPNKDKIQTSDQRFEFVLEAAAVPEYYGKDLPKSSKMDQMWPHRLEKPLGTLIQDRRGVHVGLSRQDHKGVADWVFKNPEKTAELLLGAYEQESSPSPQDDALAAANKPDVSEEPSPNPPASTEPEDIYVHSVEKPVARMKRSDQGVELTLIGERRAGFLAYVAEHGEEMVHLMMRQYERDQDIRDMTDSDGNDLPDELMGR